MKPCLYDPVGRFTVPLRKFYIGLIRLVPFEYGQDKSHVLLERKD
jgi:hypothetical protein